jgi:hypothetical protein
LFFPLSFLGLLLSFFLFFFPWRKEERLHCTDEICNLYNDGRRWRIVFFFGVSWSEQGSNVRQTNKALILQLLMAYATLPLSQLMHLYLHFSLTSWNQEDEHCRSWI